SRGHVESGLRQPAEVGALASDLVDVGAFRRAECDRVGRCYCIFHLSASNEPPSRWKGCVCGMSPLTVTRVMSRRRGQRCGHHLDRVLKQFVQREIQLVLPPGVLDERVQEHRTDALQAQPEAALAEKRETLAQQADRM